MPRTRAKTAHARMRRDYVHSVILRDYCTPLQSTLERERCVRHGWNGSLAPINVSAQVKGEDIHVIDVDHFQKHNLANSRGLPSLHRCL